MGVIHILHQKLPASRTNLTMVLLVSPFDTYLLLLALGQLKCDFLKLLSGNLRRNLGNLQRNEVKWQPNSMGLDLPAPSWRPRRGVKSFAVHLVPTNSLLEWTPFTHIVPLGNPQTFLFVLLSSVSKGQSVGKSLAIAQGCQAQLQGCPISSCLCSRSLIATLLWGPHPSLPSLSSSLPIQCSGSSPTMYSNQMSASHPWRLPQPASPVIFKSTNKLFCQVTVCPGVPMTGTVLWQHNHELRVPFDSKYPGLDNKLPCLSVIRTSLCMLPKYEWPLLITRHRRLCKVGESHQRCLASFELQVHLCWFPQA